MENNRPQQSDCICICPPVPEGHVIAPSVPGCPWHDRLDGGGVVASLGDTPFPDGLGPDVDHGPTEPTMYGHNDVELVVSPPDSPGQPRARIVAQEDDSAELEAAGMRRLTVDELDDHVTALRGESASVSPSGNRPSTTERASHQVDLDLPPADLGRIGRGRPDPVRVRASALHWAETEDAPLIRRIFRRIPPVGWDVNVWQNEVGHDSDHVFGTIDGADAHALIAAILTAHRVEEPSVAVLRDHSTTLNRVAYRMAVALGYPVVNGATSANVDHLVDQVLTRYRDDAPK